MSVRTRIFDFPGSQGHRLSGRLDLPEGVPAAYAVLAHCFTCGKNSVASVRINRALAARGIGVLRFDFTGLGQSAGDFSHATFSGDVADLVAASRAMEQEGHPALILIGHSPGGAAVLAAAGGLPGIAAVVTIGAPCDTQHVIRLLDRSLDRIIREGEARVRLGGESFVIGRAFVEDLRAQDQRHRMAHLGRPLLILHSPRHEVVSVERRGNLSGRPSPQELRVARPGRSPSDPSRGCGVCRNDDRGVGIALRSRDRSDVGLAVGHATAHWMKALVSSSRTKVRSWHT